MARSRRRSPDAVAFLDRLAGAPHRFGLFSALRRLESLYAERPRLGTSVRAADDPVRLGQQPSVAFAPSTLVRFVASKLRNAPRLKVAFFGLFGPQGPMPLHLSEYARDRERQHHDTTLTAFADVFHHRLLSFFYRAWANSQPTVQHDRPSDDDYQAWLGSTLGMGSPATRERDALPDYTKLHFAGRLSAPQRNAEGLEAMITAFFATPVRLQQFSGEWIAVPGEERCRLGTGSGAGRLGQDTNLGARVWSRQHKFSLIIGPLSLDVYRSLLPSEARAQRLLALVRNYVNYELEWDVKLILKREAVPPLELGRQGALGWTTWLGTRPGRSDADELVLSSSAFATAHKQADALALAPASGSATTSSATPA